MGEMRIGMLAARTGTNAPTIRYYEEIGLLPRANRRGGGQRSYGEGDVRRLAFIRRCRTFGFPLEDVRALVTVVEDPTRSCVEVRDAARSQLTAVQAKLVELRALERSLEELAQACDDACVGGPGPECVIRGGLDAPMPSSGCRAADAVQVTGPATQARAAAPGRSRTSAP